LLDKLVITQLVKKFSAFCGTRRFITVFTTAPPILNYMNPIHNFSPCDSNIYSNIIFPSTRRPSFLHSFIQLFRSKFCMQFSSLPCVLHASPISSCNTYMPYRKEVSDKSLAYRYAYFDTIRHFQKLY